MIILFVLMILKTHLVLKKKYFKSAHEKALRILENDDEIIIQIDDEYVKYRSTELSMEMKWIVFTDYTAKENYIFLNIEKSFRIPIDKRLVNVEDLNWLLNTIEGNNIKEIK